MVDRRFATDFAYYNPDLNRVPLQRKGNAGEMIIEGNTFGMYQGSCNYEGRSEEYQSMPRDCAAISRGISNTTFGLQRLSHETLSYTGRDECGKNFSSHSARKPVFDPRAISNPKRSRTVFQPHQIRRLQYEFEREMYMVGMKRRNLSKELDLSEKQIKIWFQNRRMKQKRDHNRKRHRSLGDIPNVCVEPGKYLREFGLDTLKISDSRNANNAQMLML